MPSAPPLFLPPAPRPLAVGRARAARTLRAPRFPRAPRRAASAHCCADPPEPVTRVRGGSGGDARRPAAELRAGEASVAARGAGGGGGEGDWAEVAGPAVTELRQEQLHAFFTETDSKYQARLGGALSLGAANFRLELRELVRSLRGLAGRCLPARYAPPSCLGFQLSNAGIAARERARERRDGRPAAWPAVRAVYSSVCVFLDLAYAGRPIERFWVLETVARLPYQAYASCLHLLSTLGWFRSPALMNMHHAEDLNEAYHLAVMESLGGDQRWIDRFTAFHASLFYFWILVVLFFVSPKQSYAFSQLLESHAVDTYEEFLHANEDVLKSLPVPEVAHIYFKDFLFYYYEFRMSDGDQATHLDYASRKRPELNSLYDVFQNILSDEQEHSTAMEACVEYVETGKPVEYNGRLVSGKSRQIKLSSERRTEFWKKWEELRNKSAHN